MIRELNLKSDQCQCDSRCTEPALLNQPFCSKHLQSKCKRASPLTGYEPKYEPDKFNNNPRVKDIHNCFAYAFDHIDMPSPEKCKENTCNVSFHQPGRQSGYPKWHKVNGKRCPDLLARLFADVPGLKPATFTQKCPPRTSKIAIVVDPKEDYHFYRQDSNGMWSHKPGSTNVTNKDATDRPIYDPELASRDYRKKSGRLNYNAFCSFLCTPRTVRHHFKRGGRRKTRKTRKTNKK